MNLWRNILNEPVDARSTVADIGPGIRERINAVRVVCVLLMMYVHVPNGQQTVSGVDRSLSVRLDHWLESILIEGPGRASAALLSMVSGYLIVLTLTRVNASIVTVYRRRFISIVLPMMFWAALTCLVYWLLDHGGDNFVNMADSWHSKLNLVLFMYEAPYGATLHLAFLRDLFVCVLLSPLLLIVLRHIPKSTIGLLVFVYIFEHSGKLYIILRPLVVLGFTMGMLLALRRVGLDRLDKYWAWHLSLMGVFSVLIIWTNAGLLSSVETYLAMQGISLKESILYPLCRLFGSLTIWCSFPMWKGERIKQLVNEFSPYLFSAFCSHFLVLTVLFNGLWMPVLGDRDSYFYFVWFLSAPLVAMVASIIMVNVAARVFPSLATLITGGRISVRTLTRTAAGKFASAA